MGWVCLACTFENRQEEATKCEICETERGETWNLGHQPSALSSSAATASSDYHSAKANKPPPVKPAAVQQTLFGKSAPKREEKRKSKKRKLEKTTMKQSRLPCSSQQTANNATCVKGAPLATLEERAKIVMKETFKIRKLRALQPAAIKCALQRQSQTLILATGGGKSLCFQLPAVVLGGTTIVISPLIALMNDQVQSLVSKGIEAAVISSSQGERRNVQVMERLLGYRLSTTTRKKKGNDDEDCVVLKPVTLLYCTPEQIQTERFRNILKELYKSNRLAMFAIDEAHAISDWGHDFRPSYRKLCWLRETMPDVPCMACTATATRKVIQDIQTILNLTDAPCHVGSFDRKNIYYKVAYKDALDALSPHGAIGHLIAFVKRRHESAAKHSKPCSGLIYVHKREDTTDIATQISNGTGIRAVAYHGGLKADERTSVQEAWTTGQVEIAVATVAFGMGVDLAHVRYVVHWNLSKSIEAFYQESGRAGRDGEAAISLLYYSEKDARKFEFLVQQRSSKGDEKGPQRALEALEKMVEYCMSPGCRRQYLLKHFGEQNSDPLSVCGGTCDFCKNPEQVERAIEQASTRNDFTYHTAKPKSSSWNGQHEKPVDDDESLRDDEFDCSWRNCDLRITGEAPSDDPFTNESAKKPPGDPFTKASATLAKYEAIECQQNQQNGFVTFKQKAGAPKSGGSRRDIPRVPDHLRAKLPDPMQHFESKKNAETKTSSDFAAEAERLRQDLAKIKAEQAATNKQMKAGKAPHAPPPPPPPISFGSKKHR